MGDASLRAAPVTSAQQPFPCNARQMHRRDLFVVALGSLSIVIIALMVGFRDNTELIQALAAAGTMHAAIFAFAATWQARSAAQASGVAAARATEALARMMKPTMYANVHTASDDPTKAVGGLTLSGHSARDAHVAWHLRNGRKVTTEVAEIRLDPTGGNRHLPMTIPLNVAWLGSEADTIDKVVIDYADEARLMPWRLTRRWFQTAEAWRAAGYEPPLDERQYLDVSDEPIQAVH